MTFAEYADHYELLVVEQVKSSIGTNNRRLTEERLNGLNLGKIGRRSIVKARPEVLGAIKKVAHLVVVRAFGEPKSAPCVDELNDIHSNAINSDDALLELRMHLNAYTLKASKEPLAAVYQASAALAILKRRPGLIAKAENVDRRDLSLLTKGLYRSMFSRDNLEASQAAYALVANSKSFGNGLDPAKSVNTLSVADIEKFKSGLISLMDHVGIKFITVIDAVSKKRGGSDVTVDVHVAISRDLPFKIGDSKPVLPKIPNFNVDPKQVIIGSPVASEMIDTKIINSKNDHLLFEAVTQFVFGRDAIVSHKIPVVVMAPGVFENRIIPVTAA